jgi:hypothetical protein
MVAAAQPSIDQQVQRIIAYANDYRNKVPSLECDETILSQKVVSGKVKQTVKIETTLRELRDETQPGGFTDSYTYKLVNGKPAKPNFKRPYFVYNVFSNSLNIGEKPLPACFDYRFSTIDDGRTQQFTIDSKSVVIDPACSKIPNDYHKIMLIDTASGAVRHVERTMSPQYAQMALEIPWIVIDYAPQKLGDQTFWLPIRFEARDQLNQGRMIATYSNFHRYQATARILP